MKHILFALLFVLPVSSFSQNADINVLRTINSHSSPFLDNGFKFISNTTDGVAIALPIGMLITGIIKKDKKMKVNGLEMGISYLVAGGISDILKYSINRPRPFDTYPFIVKKSSGGNPSFPSGHATSAFSTATSLSLCYPKWYVIVPSYLWACSVAYSRMYLGVHYPTDVLGGMIIGSGSALLVHKIRKGIYKRHHDYDNMVPKF